LPNHAGFRNGARSAYDEDRSPENEEAGEKTENGATGSKGPTDETGGLVRGSFKKDSAEEEADTKCDESRSASSNQSRQECDTRQNQADDSSNGLPNQHAEEARSHEGTEMQPPANEPAPPAGVDFPEHENGRAVEQDILPEWRAEVGHA
jgi:hypothetical protein